MSDLVAFLEARLDEDERIARAVEDRSAPFDGQWKNDDNRALRTYNDWVLAYKPNAEPWAPGVLDHIARHDPARVLAEITAKRDHLKMWTEAQERRDKALKLATSDNELARKASGSARAEANGYCEAVMRLVSQDAAIYADHPDFDPAWR